LFGSIIALQGPNSNPEAHIKSKIKDIRKCSTPDDLINLFGAVDFSECNPVTIYPITYEMLSLEPNVIFDSILAQLKHCKDNNMTFIGGTEIPL